MQYRYVYIKGLPHTHTTFNYSTLRIDPANISTLFSPLLIKNERRIRSKRFFINKYNAKNVSSQRRKIKNSDKKIM